MKLGSSTFWQTALVWTLFLASIGTLLVNSFTAFLVPGQEQTARRQIREAALKLVDAAASNEKDSNDNLHRQGSANQRWEELTRATIRDYPGIEGGFYLNDPDDKFAGYAFPTGPDGHRHAARRDPPPREEPYIRLQARQSATQQEQIDIQSRDVGPSRVIVATAPVGASRPAKVIVWLMYRVTGPEQHLAQMVRFRVSTYLALGGIAAALLLTWRLGRTLARERAARDQLRDELRRSEHLASLGTLLAQVAHEVRNPLAGIRSTVQLWERLPDEARTPESLQAVVAAVDRLNALLHHLLYFSKTENSARKPVNLNAVVRETFDLLQAQAAQQNVGVDVELDARLPDIQGSETGLRQVVLNLATNALQAMTTGGRLTCRTRFDTHNNSLVFEIEDTGSGIDPAVKARLFEPFFTTRAQGTGLGLALCREIVLQHDGRIELEPGKSRGTICRVVLPLRSPSN